MFVLYFTQFIAFTSSCRTTISSSESYWNQKCIRRPLQPEQWYLYLNILNFSILMSPGYLNSEISLKLMSESSSVYLKTYLSIQIFITHISVIIPSCGVSVLDLGSRKPTSKIDIVALKPYPMISLIIHNKIQMHYTYVSTSLLVVSQFWI